MKTKKNEFKTQELQLKPPPGKKKEHFNQFFNEYKTSSVFFLGAV
jgi:hypothetical protein